MYFLRKGISTESILEHSYEQTVSRNIVRKSQPLIIFYSTGAKPHKCHYAGCDKRFSDPARRHKHMVEVHKYIPQGPRKRNRTVNSYHENQ